MWQIILILSLLIIILLLIIRYFWRKTIFLQEEIDSLISKKQSLSTRYGKLTEQFLPFLADYPYNESRFRFLGTPIDGIQFEEDKIVFIEFKAADSRLTSAQNKIKKLVQSGAVKFEEFYLIEKEQNA